MAVFVHPKNTNKETTMAVPATSAEATKSQIPLRSPRNPLTSDDNPVQHSDRAKTREFIQQTQSLRYMLEKNLIECDAKWTLFVAAALSYRFDSILRPFPPRFIIASGRNINHLVTVINDTPSLRVVLQHIVDQQYDEINVEVIDLLHWVLVIMRDPQLREVNAEEFDALMESMGQKLESFRPSHVFEIQPGLYSNSEEDFRRHSGNYFPKLAFHGNKLESFFKMIHQQDENGNLPTEVCAAANQTNPEDEAILMNTQLVGVLRHSPIGAGWGASLCGAMISCIGIGEFLNNPEHIRQRPEDGGDADTAANTEFELCNSKLMHLRYILFYGSRLHYEEERNKPFNGNEKFDLSKWIKRHKYSLSLAGYMLLLISIGVANSGSGQYLKHMIGKKAFTLLDFCRRLYTPATPPE